MHWLALLCHEVLYIINTSGHSTADCLGDIRRSWTVLSIACSASTPLSSHPRKSSCDSASLSSGIPPSTREGDCHGDVGCGYSRECNVAMRVAKEGVSVDGGVRTVDIPTEATGYAETNSATSLWRWYTPAVLLMVKVMIVIFPWYLWSIAIVSRRRSWTTLPPWEHASS